jgi:hypothetical protein
LLSSKPLKTLEVHVRPTLFQHDREKQLKGKKTRKKKNVYEIDYYTHTLPFYEVI